MVEINIIIHIYLGISSFIVGMIVILLGMIVKGRFSFMKTNKKYFKTHKIVAYIFSILILTSFFFGFFSLIIEGQDVLQSIHSVFGLILVIIVMLQVIPSMLIKNRIKIKGIHRYLGYILSMILTIQFIIGIIQAISHFTE
ncbi:MAG: DUF4079 family protein [Promethearchaeota archaeon]